MWCYKNLEIQIRFMTKLSSAEKVFQTVESVLYVYKNNELSTFSTPNNVFC